MRLLPQKWLRAAMLAVLAFFGTQTCLLAQGNVQKVPIDSPDGIDLRGFWYPCAKKNAPAVLMLHALGAGEDSSKQEWRNLATLLQKEYAVLALDFRGHGESVNVANPQMFWNYNKNVATPNGNGATVSFKDFSPAAYSYFVNDIAAAKKFLDGKNDAGECNSSSLILIGAETGATLGAIWMNSECLRFRYMQPKPPFTPGGLDLKEPAIKNVMCAVFLSITHKLGNKNLNIFNILNGPTKTYAIPTAFLYNPNNDLEKAMGEGLDKTFTKKGDPRYQYTGVTKVNNAAKLTGRELLQAGTDKQIVGYLDALVQNAKFNPWTQIDLKSNQYFWRFGALPGSWVQAYPAPPNQGGKTFAFYGYTPFAQ